MYRIVYSLASEGEAGIDVVGIVSDISLKEHYMGQRSRKQVLLQKRGNFTCCECIKFGRAMSARTHAVTVNHLLFEPLPRGITNITN